jgi:hypothetical protein
MRVSFEVNHAHCASHSLGDSVNNARCPAFLVNWLDSKLHADVGESAPLIDFDDLLPGLLQLLFVNRLVQSQFDFFTQSLRFYAFGSVNNDFAQDRTRLDGNDDLYPIALRLSINTNVLNRASLVECRNIVPGPVYSTSIERTMGGACAAA